MNNPLSPSAPENLVSQDRFGRHCSFSTLRLNLALTPEILPAFHDGVHIYHQPPSGQSRVNRVTQLCTDGAHCRESNGTGPVVLKVVSVTGGVFSGFAVDHFFMRLYFLIPTIGMM